MKPEFYRVYEDLYRDYLYHVVSNSDTRYEYFFRVPKSYADLSPELTKEMLYETQRAIDNASERRDGYAVRPDAKYFLLVNFYEMVLRPIAAELQLRGPVGERFNRDMMREDLKHDVEMILDAAEERARSSADRPDVGWDEEGSNNIREISGHNVIDAIGGAWDKIKYNEYLYWGRTNE